MKTLKKSIYLILGLFVFGFVSCANDSSGSESDAPQQLLDRYNNAYRDGLYEYDDGYTKMYLYYEDQNLVAAGDLDNEYDSGRVSILRQSHTWRNAHQYCVEWNYRCEWYSKYYKRAHAEEAFKKGWWKLSGNNYYGQSEIKIFYFEGYSNSSSYYAVEKDGTIYSAGYHSYFSWADYYCKEYDAAFLSEDVDYYKPLSSLFKKGWWKINTTLFYYYENPTEGPLYYAIPDYDYYGNELGTYRYTNDQPDCNIWTYEFVENNICFENGDVDHFGYKPEESGSE